MKKCFKYYKIFIENGEISDTFYGNSNKIKRDIAKFLKNKEVPKYAMSYLDEMISSIVTEIGNLGKPSYKELEYKKENLKFVLSLQSYVESKKYQENTNKFGEVISSKRKAQLKQREEQEEELKGIKHQIKEKIGELLNETSFLRYIVNKIKTETYCVTTSPMIYVPYIFETHYAGYSFHWKLDEPKHIYNNNRAFLVDFDKVTKKTKNKEIVFAKKVKKKNKPSEIIFHYSKIKTLQSFLLLLNHMIEESFCPSLMSKDDI